MGVAWVSALFLYTMSVEPSGASGFPDEVFHIEEAIFMMVAPGTLVGMLMSLAWILAWTGWRMASGWRTGHRHDVNL